ncbi:MAG: hypothetical protein J6A16_04915 [Oscillospiraceae bacterium]|nr:hypothetical protein [Oscillospiraceae bacterium]
MIKVIPFALGAIAIGALVAWLFNNGKKSKNFEQIYASTFTLEQAKKWVKDQASADPSVKKITIVKFNKLVEEVSSATSLLESLDIPQDESDRYLAMVTIDEKSKIDIKLLVHFDTLDEALEEFLGNEGMVVINC